MAPSPRLALAVASLLAGPAAGQTPGQHLARVEPCRAGTIERIEIRNNSLFGPGELEGHRFQTALGFADWVHIRTREGYIRGELLFREGDCFREEDLSESERLIRDLDFISRVEAVGTPAADSTWVVVVETWDEWSTQAVLDIDVENELQIKGFFVQEKNLLGRGLRLSFLYRDFRQRDDRSLSLSTGQFLGTRANAAVSVGSTSTGHLVEQVVSYPFVSEAGRFSFGSRVKLEEYEYSFPTGDRSGFSHALLPLDDFLGGVSLGRRWGEPGALTFLGAEVDVVHRDVAGSVRQVFDFDFGQRFVAPDSVADLVGSAVGPDSHVRVGVTAGARRVRYTTARGLDLVRGTQTVAAGGDLEVTLGRSLGTFGTSGPFTWTRFDGWVGGARAPFYAHAEVLAEGRRLDSVDGLGDRWKDLNLRGRVLVYIQPGSSHLYTTVTGVRVRLRDNLAQPFRTTLGGEGGVRAYLEEDIPTGSTVVAFLEQRIALPWFDPGADVGITVFGDLGRGWAGDVPFGADTGWRGAIGGGLRLGFPARTGTVTHVEVAWPVGDALGRTGPVLRTYWSPTLTSR